MRPAPSSTLGTTPDPTLPHPIPDLDRLLGIGGGDVVAPSGWRNLRERTAGLRVRVATAGLWLLIALAAAGGLRGLLLRPPAAPPAGAAAPPAGAAGFAELFVATWLESGSGQEAALAPFYPHPVDLGGVTPSGRYASRTAAVAASEPAPGYWAITVGAEVLVASQGGYVRAGTHYYRVGVATGTGAPAATSLPAEVPAPSPGPLPAAGLPPLTAPGDDAAAAALGRFFDAFLAGHGASPGVAPVSPAPFASVALVGVGTVTASPPGRRTVLAEVAATDAGGLKTVLDYSVEMSNGPGGWVVSAVLPAPPIGGSPQGGRR